MIEDQLAEIAAGISRILASELSGGSGELYRSAYHLPKQGGKRLRPFLVVKSCEIVGGNVADALPAAAAVEMLHNFTLVHDDIMDNDLLRRGVPTVHIVWGEPLAILAGDLLFAKSFQLLLSRGGSAEQRRRAAEVLATATVLLSEGQHLDMKFEEMSTVTEGEYLEMISGKTAALFKASAEIGAIMGGAADPDVDRLGKYGWNLGMGFQIFDDYLALKSTEDVLGKAVGNDIKEGKKTLIVIKGLETASRDQLKALLGRKDASDDALASLISSLESNGAIEYARSKAESYIESALGAIGGFPPSAAKESLSELARLAISRKK
uniref:Polyprenyl synthetase family protein n=1 Tax=Candidatus Methanomethylicus mesodigestus TaxID=1867258 RepID=A0A7C3IXH5_9CREN